jgi:hypothetical protein
MRLDVSAHPDIRGIAPLAPVYPRGMAGNSSEPPPTGERVRDESPGDVPKRAKPRAERELYERYGKLLLRRVAKRDGRALILYTREPER